MKIKNTELTIIKGNITNLEVDAIVNAADGKLVMVSGVALAIKKKGGQNIEDEAIKKGPIKVGEVVATGAGDLIAKFVIHAAVMGADGKTDEVKIRSGCANSLKLAQKLNLNTIAFPALGCGAGGFTVKATAKIMAQEVLRHAKYDSNPLKEIIFVLYDDETFNEFNKIVSSYLDYIQNKLSQGPFVTADIIIEVPARRQGRKGGIVLVERSNPPFGWAIPGGFMDYGESLEECAAREAKEETGLDIYDLKQMHTYSKPGRDPRFQTVTAVFAAKAKGRPKAGDDAQNVKVVTLKEAKKLKLAFDHKNVLDDYSKFRKKNK